MAESSSIWVGNIPVGTTYSKLEDIFSKYGVLVSPYPVTIVRKSKHNCHYAFVDFVSSSSVANLLAQNPKIWIGSYLLIIKQARPKNTLTEKWRRSFIDGVEKLNFRSLPCAKEMSMLSVWIENLNHDIKSQNVYTILKSINNVFINKIPKLETQRSDLLLAFGQLSKPGVSIFPRPNSTTCDAFANFISISGVSNILASKSNVILYGRPLKIVPLGTEESDSQPYYLIKILNLPHSITRFEILNGFKKFGKIAEPPSVGINQELSEAYVPFAYFTSAERAVIKFNGVVRINKVPLSVEPMFDLPECTKETLRILETREANNLRSNDAPIRPQLCFSSVVSDCGASASSGQSLSASALTEPNTGIQIRNVNSLTSEKVLLQYFENDRRSNGGKVVDFTCDKRYDRAVVIFEKLEVAENVLNKVNGHILEGNTLYVSKLPPVCSDRIFLENIPNWLMADKKWLEYYVEAAVRCDVKLRYLEQDRNAMVLFKEEKDVESLKKDFLARPLKDGRRVVVENELKICSIVHSDGILVHGKIPSEDSLVLALEEFLKTKAPIVNPNVRYVFRKEEHEMWLVVFEDYRAITYLDHCIAIGEQLFRVAPFCDYLGWLESFVFN